METTERILVVGAHADDADFGAAGTMIKKARQGHEIYYLICTSGDKGGTQNKATADELVKIRKKEQEDVAEMIGAKGVYFLGRHDGELVNDANLRKDIVRVIREVKPDVMYSFDPANHKFDGFHLFHSDHRNAAIAVFDAVYPAAKNRLYFTGLLAEGLEPHKVQSLYFYGTHEPNHWENISDVIDEKVKVIQGHKSQFNGERAEMVSEYMKERAKRAAENKPYDFAEVFRVISFPF